MYQVVKKQNWTIHGLDNQPAPGFLITVADIDTGDSFNLEVPNLNPEVVQQRVQAHLDQRRAIDLLTFS